MAWNKDGDWAENSPATNSSSSPANATKQQRATIVTLEARAINLANVPFVTTGE